MNRELFLSFVQQFPDIDQCENIVVDVIDTLFKQFISTQKNETEYTSDHVLAVNKRVRAIEQSIIKKQQNVYSPVQILTMVPNEKIDLSQVAMFNDITVDLSDVEFPKNTFINLCLGFILRPAEHITHVLVRVDETNLDPEVFTPELTIITDYSPVFLHGYTKNGGKLPILHLSLHTVASKRTPLIVRVGEKETITAKDLLGDNNKFLNIKAVNSFFSTFDNMSCLIADRPATLRDYDAIDYEHSSQDLLTNDLPKQSDNDESVKLLANKDFSIYDDMEDSFDEDELDDEDYEYYEKKINRGNKPDKTPISLDEIKAFEGINRRTFIKRCTYIKYEFHATSADAKNNAELAIIGFSNFIITHRRQQMYSKRPLLVSPFFFDASSATVQKMHVLPADKSQKLRIYSFGVPSQKYIDWFTMRKGMLYRFICDSTIKPTDFLLSTMINGNFFGIREFKNIRNHLNLISNLSKVHECAPNGLNDEQKELFSTTLKRLSEWLADNEKLSIFGPSTWTDKDKKNKKKKADENTADNDIDVKKIRV